MKDLRDELERACTLDGRRQWETIKSLRQRFGHSIELEEIQPRRNDRSRQYNCYMYALNVHQGGEVRACAIASDEGLPRAAFLDYLIRIGFLVEISADELRNTDIALYYDQERVKHAGRIQGDRVLSKWGTGNLYSHSLLEVPISYGAAIRFFRCVPEAEIVDAFRAYRAL